MHPLHKLGNANTVTNSHEYYKTLLNKNGTANGAASNAYLTTSYVPVKPSASIWSTEQEPCTTKSMRYGLSTEQA